MTVTATPLASSPPTTTTPSEQDTISLFDLLLVLVKYRKMIIGITVAAARVSAGVALNMPNIPRKVMDSLHLNALS